MHAACQWIVHMNGLNFWRKFLGPWAGKNKRNNIYVTEAAIFFVQTEHRRLINKTEF